MNKLWFKRKTYGWGWTPASAMGWLVILLYVVCLVVYPILSKIGYFSFSLGFFLLITTAFTALLIWICFMKGEKPSWNWGE